MKLKILIMSAMVLLLAFLSFGTVKEYGKDLGYPAQYAFTILPNHSQVNREEVFKGLENLAKENDLKIYKPFLDDNNNYQTFVFGNINDSKYITDMNQLKNNDINGMYYVNKNMTVDMENAVKKLNVEMKGAVLGWYVIPLYFLFQTLRALAIWSIFFIFGSILFAIKLLYRKKMMVHRSIGYFKQVMKREIIEDILLLSTLTSSVLLVALIAHQGYDNVFFKSFATLIVVNFVILFIIILLANLMAMINIKLTNILAVIKNMKVSKVIVYIWLVFIIISIFISSMTIAKSIDLIKASDNQIKVLNKWSPAKNYLGIEWQSIIKTSSNGEMDREQIKQDTNKKIKFLESLDKTAYIYAKNSKLSNENITHMSDQFKQQLIKDNINLAIGNHIQYVNFGFIAKNKVLYPHNKYFTSEDEVLHHKVIVYVPEKFNKQLEGIKNIIYYEQFYSLPMAPTDFKFIIVPNDQVNFLFNYKLAENELFAKQEEKDLILVQLNLSQYTPDMLMYSTVNNIVMDSIYDKHHLKENLSQANLTHYAQFIKVAEQMLLEKQKLENQLLGTLIALVILSIVQIFIIYQYIVTVIKNNAKRLAVYHLFSKSIMISLIKLISPLFFGLVFVTMILLYNTIDKNIVALLMTIYCLEMLLISLFAIYQFKKKQVQILKGDFEVL